MNFQSLLDFDKNLLISLQGVIPAQYSSIVTILAESIVVWCAIFLVGTWLYGTFQKNDDYKKQALQVFGLIVSVFVIYTIVNLCVPQWRFLLIRKIIFSLRSPFCLPSLRFVVACWVVYIILAISWLVSFLGLLAR